MKSIVMTVMLAFALLGCCVVPSMGQGVTTGYTLFVTFFYPLHFLYNVQVTVRDPSGRVVGSGMSYDGDMVVIPVRTEGSSPWLSAYAVGYASGPLTNYVVNPSFWVVAGRSDLPVSISGGDYWITINLYQ